MCLFFLISAYPLGNFPPTGPPQGPWTSPQMMSRIWYIWFCPEDNAIIWAREIKIPRRVGARRLVLIRPPQELMVLQQENFSVFQRTFPEAWGTQTGSSRVHFILGPGWGASNLMYLLYFKSIIILWRLSSFLLILLNFIIFNTYILNRWFWRNGFLERKNNRTGKGMEWLC